MTEQTRRNVLKYGIAIDLVILAAGVGMLLPATPALLIGAFALATTLSVVRGGWQGALLAGFLSIITLAGVFPELIRPAHLLTFIVAALAGSVALTMATRPRLMIHAPAPAIAAAAAPIAVPAEPKPTFAEKPLERSPLIAVPPFAPASEPASAHAPEPVPAPNKKSAKRLAREAKEEARRAKELEQRLAREGAEAERVEAERVAAQEARRRAEEERERVAREFEAELERGREQAARVEAERLAAEEARQRAEQEAARVARELEEKLAREREEAARIEAERVAAEEGRQRAEEEAARVARELEEKLAREREEAARIEAERVAAEEARQRAEEEAARVARELEEKLAREREEAARIEAERVAAEEARQRAEEERQRLARHLEERLAQEREQARLEAERMEAERRAAEEARRAADEDRVRIGKELEQKLAEQREEARREQARIEEARRALEERLEQERVERERLTAERERLTKELEARQSRDREETTRLEAERRAAEEARIRAEAERIRIEAELEERLAQERQATERDLHERLDAERKAAEEDLRRQLEEERERASRELAVERQKIEKDASERVAAAQRAAEAATTNVRPAPVARAAKPAAPAESKSLLGTISGWFKREPVSSRNVNLKTKRLTTNTATKTAASASNGSRTKTPPTPGKPRLLFIERRRGTVDTVVPKLKHRSVDVEVVERWVDAVDEIFRFRPSALFLDVEHPEFDKIHKTLSDKTSQLPIVLTGRSIHAVPAGVRYAAFVQRPYDVDDLSRIAQTAHARPEDLLAEQSIPRSMTMRTPAPPQVATPTPKPARPAAPPPAAAVPAPAPHAAAPAHVHEAKEVVEEPQQPVRVGASTNDEYEVACFTCRAPYNAVDADWCSCLAKERSLVCTNCLACFCKAPPAYKERFWVEAPPRLFERKTTEARRQDGSLAPNPAKDEVTRPLVLTVEDDEEIQTIVQRVCSNLGYGFIWANNGQDGLELAREYRPNMILSDAFMPKLDGREMCRILKEEPIGADMRMVVMTGLYTDTKYRSEAVKRFHVDDYIAKPVAITDLINLLQKHLEGVSGLPMQEDLHELHRKDLDVHEGNDITLPSSDDEMDMPLSDLLAPPAPLRRKDAYDVACFNCQLTFDATRAEWCSCVGRDNTLVCEHCSGCFCKAPAAYRERFWIDAPPSLFERKMIGSKRALTNGHNPPAMDVKRPLILLVEDDENVQLIVRTVVSSMGYGFVVGANGQEGLTLAREYNPDLILSDAFMPKLDGREMCRLLKEDPVTARSKAIIMTGLYTDRKYRNEALDYFKVDDYVAKPLAVDDLIKLFKKHLPQEVTTTH
jgi:CheY-like chemotaxis protein